MDRSGRSNDNISRQLQHLPIYDPFDFDVEETRSRPGSRFYELATVDSPATAPTFASTLINDITPIKNKPNMEQKLVEDHHSNRPGSRFYELATVDSPATAPTFASTLINDVTPLKTKRADMQKVTEPSGYYDFVFSNRPDNAFTTSPGGIETLETNNTSRADDIRGSIPLLGSELNQSNYQDNSAKPGASQRCEEDNDSITSDLSVDEMDKCPGDLDNDQLSSISSVESDVIVVDKLAAENAMKNQMMLYALSMQSFPPKVNARTAASTPASVLALNSPLRLLDQSGEGIGPRINTPNTKRTTVTFSEHDDVLEFDQLQPSSTPVPALQEIPVFRGIANQPKRVATTLNSELLSSPAPNQSKSDWAYSSSTPSLVPSSVSWSAAALNMSPLTPPLQETPQQRADDTETTLTLANALAASQLAQLLFNAGIPGTTDAGSESTDLNDTHASRSPTMSASAISSPSVGGSPMQKCSIQYSDMPSLKSRTNRESGGSVGTSSKRSVRSDTIVGGNTLRTVASSPSTGTLTGPPKPLSDRLLQLAQPSQERGARLVVPPKVSTECTVDLPATAIDALHELSINNSKFGRLAQDVHKLRIVMSIMPSTEMPAEVTEIDIDHLSNTSTSTNGDANVPKTKISPLAGFDESYFNKETKRRAIMYGPKEMLLRGSKHRAGGRPDQELLRDPQELRAELFFPYRVARPKTLSKFLHKTTNLNEEDAAALNPTISGEAEEAAVSTSASEDMKATGSGNAFSPQDIAAICGLLPSRPDNPNLHSSGAINLENVGRAHSFFFRCLLLDIALQVVDVYDVHSNSTDMQKNGVHVGPCFLSSFTFDSKRPSSHACLCEIDFSIVAPNVFCVIPIITETTMLLRAKGEQYIVPLPPPLNFSLTLYQLVGPALTSVPDVIQDEMVAAELDGLTPATPGWEQAMGYREQGISGTTTWPMKKKRAADEKVKSLYSQDQMAKRTGESASVDAKQWEVLEMTSEDILFQKAAGVNQTKRRSTERRGGTDLEFDSIASISALQRGEFVDKVSEHDSKRINGKRRLKIKLSARESVAPFAVFRSAGQGRSTTWCWKTLSLVVESAHVPEMLPKIVQTLREQAVLPFHLVHVEHCFNCECHQLTTRHIPGSYEKAFAEMRDVFKMRLPPIIIFANDSTILHNEPPRLGSFEVALRPYYSSHAQLLYSKRSLKILPNVQDLVGTVSSLLLPKSFQIFGAAKSSPSKNPNCDVVVYDSHTKCRLSGVLVEAYAVSIGVTEPRSIENTRLFIESTLAQYQAEVDNDEDDHGEMCIIDKTLLASFQSSRNAGGKIGARGPKLELDRQLRNWGRQDVIDWLISHGCDNNVIVLSQQAGCIDGHSAAAMVTEKSLVRWGCKNRKVLHNVLADLNRIKAADVSERQGELSHEVGAPISGLPEPFLQGDKCVFTRVSVAKTSSDGIAALVLPGEGSYVLKLAGTEMAVTWTRVHMFSRNDLKSRGLWTVALRPVLRRVVILAEVDPLNYGADINRENAKFTDRIGCFITSLVSLRTCRKYCVKLRTIDFATAIPSIQARFHHFKGVFLAGETYLPCGKYYSDVDGAIVSLTAVMTNITTSVDMISKPVVLKYKENQILTKHNKLVRYFALLVQEALPIVRFRRALPWLGLKLSTRILLRQLLRRIRERIRQRKATKIQALFRKLKQRYLFLVLRKGFVVLQALYRGINTRAWLAWHRDTAEHERLAAIKIQSQVRRYFAQKIVWIQKKLKTVRSSNVMFTFSIALMRRVGKIRKRKAIIIAEQQENIKMEIEEKRMRLHLTQLQDQLREAKLREKRLLQERLQAMERTKIAKELHRKRSARIIQAFARGVNARKNVNIAKDAVVTIQSLLRRRLSNKRVALIREKRERKLDKLKKQQLYQERLTTQALEASKKTSLSQKPASAAGKLIAGFGGLFSSKKTKPGAAIAPSTAPLASTWRSIANTPEDAEDEGIYMDPLTQSLLDRATFKPAAKLQSMLRMHLVRSTYRNTREAQGWNEGLPMRELKFIKVIPEDPMYTDAVQNQPSPTWFDSFENAPQDFSYLLHEDNNDQTVEQGNDGGNEGDVNNIPQPETMLVPEPISTPAVTPKFSRLNILPSIGPAFASLFGGGTGIAAAKELKKVRAVVLIQATVRGMLSRQGLYSHPDWQRAVEKMLGPPSTENYDDAPFREESGYGEKYPSIDVIPLHQSKGTLAGNSLYINTENDTCPHPAVGGFNNYPSVVLSPASTNSPISSLLSTGSPIDKPRFRPNLSIVTDPNAVSKGPATVPARPSVALAQGKNPSGQSKTPTFFSMMRGGNSSVASEGHSGASTPTPRSSWSLTTPGTPMHAAASKLKESAKLLQEKSATLGTSLLGQAKAAVVAGVERANQAAEKARQQAADYLARQKAEQERIARRNQNNVSIEDAVLHIRGFLGDTSFPEIERQWYVAVFPRASTQTARNEGREAHSAMASSAVSATGLGLGMGLPVNTYTISESKEKGAGMKGLISNGQRQLDAAEASQTVPLFPLSPLTFSSISFYSHLTDLTRYEDVEVVIFIETFGNSYTPKAGTDAAHAGSVTVSKSLALNTPNNFYAPAFYGECHLGRGGIFSPSGGRMHLNLKPISSVLANVPRGPAHIKKGGMKVILTLLPAALPPSVFLRTFRGFRRPAPCYPSSLVDAPLLESCTIQWDAISGAAIAAGCFRDRLLVSTRNKGLSLGQYEFDEGGKLTGTITDAPVSFGNVLLICSGHNHVAFCSASGNIMAMQGGDSSGSITPSQIASTGSIANHWGKAIFVNAHPMSGIVCGTMIAYAGMDLLITADKASRIAVVLLERGTVLRQFLNEPFTHSRIVSLVSCCMHLYLGHDDGSITCISLSAMLGGGDMNNAGVLYRFVTSQETIFHSGNGIGSALTCMSTFTGNGFLGLKDEDEMRHQDDIKARKMTPVTSKEVVREAVRSTSHSIVEGHILLVGGGDADPVLKVLRPMADGMHVLVTLNGHSKAITAVAADACGRHIFTGSTGDRKIIVWDGLTFAIERTLQDVNVGSLILGPDCLMVTSFKPPFLRLWKVFTEQTVPTKKQDAKINTFSDLQAHENRKLEITTVRSSRWCLERLRGSAIPVASSIVKPLYLEEEPTRLVLTRWMRQYYRFEAIPTVYTNPNPSGTPMARKSSTPRARARQEYDSLRIKNSKSLGSVQLLTDAPNDAESEVKIFEANEKIRIESERQKFRRSLRKKHPQWSDSDEDEEFKVCYVCPPGTRKRRTVAILHYTHYAQQQEHYPVPMVETNSHMGAANSALENSNANSHHSTARSISPLQQSYNNNDEEEDYDDDRELAIERAARIRPRLIKHLTDQSDDENDE